GMGRGKDTVRRHLWRAVLQLMKPAHRTEFLTVPSKAPVAISTSLPLMIRLLMQASLSAEI
ncbi:hypothetical protein, partial [Sinorhizobium meliloti]|uniref:hypothetical protein n=1 Tax=Rhizobium meliloti TaxID=382 RepID=UPI001AECF86A